MTSSMPAGSGPAGRFERLSLRARLMTVGLIGVAGSLVLGGVLLYAVLTGALTRAVQAGALSSAREVALLVGTSGVPDPVPVSGAQVVQVLDAQGRVVSGSPTADRLTPLVTEEERLAAVAGDGVVVAGNRAGLSGMLHVAAVPVNAGGSRLTVVAAAPAADVETSGRTLRLLLLGLLPIMLAVLAAIAWRIIGAALRPVEALRLGAARIDAASSDTERLPVPAARDEISALATTLNDMLDRVAAARRTQRAFVADAAHELRSPLASMRTQLEVAQRLGEGGTLPADLLPDVHRLSALVEDLLLLARTDERRGTPQLADMDLRDLLPRVLNRYAGARVPVLLEAADEPLPVHSSEDELVRAVTNVLDNAVRHARSVVRLEVLQPAGSVTVVVTDDGHGIPAEDRERVFDRFTRLDEARDRDRGGTGLGLAITRELLHRVGGSIRLDDAAPGVRAVITLPAGAPQSARPTWKATQP
jgi:signal transduction histidine kinase